MVCFQCPTPIPIPIPIQTAYNNNVQNCFHWNYSGSYSNSYSDTDGFCTQFDTDTGTK